jgi:fumarate reductase (CoM/CoB) subunit A
MNIKISREIKTDILVIGGGLAAIKAAIECSKSDMKVLIATKGKICSGSSFYPLMGALGCQGPIDEVDKKYFMEEINESSFSMNDQELNKIYIDEIQDRVKELPEMGVAYSRLEGGRIACFAKRPRNIFTWKNWEEIRKNVYKIFEANDNIGLMEGTNIIRLIKKRDSIAGAVAIETSGELLLIHAKAIILCTGGFGDIYKHSLNTPDVTGDGQILALDVGAKLVNLEFIQFIPGLTKPQYKLLFSEQTLLYCKGILDEKGQDILKRYLPEGVSERDCINERAKHGPFTSADISKYFDIAMMNEIKGTGSEAGFIIKISSDILRDKRDFMVMYLDWIMKEKGIDIINEGISIAPFAHASNGGILIDKNCSVGVKGLFAAGEVAGGVHGADRHGGNASGSCLVFGKRAADSAVQYARNCSSIKVEIKEAQEVVFNKFNANVKSEFSPEDAISKIKNIMWFNANVVRSESGLVKAIGEVKKIDENYNGMDYFVSSLGSKLAVKARHTIDLSRILLNVMLLRRESRGSHYRSDYPELNNQGFNKRIISFRNSQGEIEYSFI